MKIDSMVDKRLVMIEEMVRDQDAPLAKNMI